MNSGDCIEVEHVEKTFGTHAGGARSGSEGASWKSLWLPWDPTARGKSTTIRMLMSIIRPDSGSIRVLGGDALKHKDRIGYLPEERGVYRKMRVGEFLRFVAQLKGVHNERIECAHQRMA